MAGGSLDILIQAKDEASAVLESLQGRMQKLGNEGPTAFNQIDTAAASVHSRLTGLYTAAVAVGTAFVSGKLVQVPAQFESISAQLETVTKSSQKAKEGMAWVQEFAQKTPYELSQVADAFAKLTGYGFDPEKILTPIGNAASGMQKGLDQAVEAYADATRGEFERLKEFGINAETVGNQVTLRWMQDGQQMEKTVAKNAEKIGDALSGIWTDLFSGGMDKQMDTFAGRWSNLLDTVTRSINAFMGAGLFESVKAKLAEITAALQSLETSGKLEQWGKAAADALNKVWDVLKVVGQHVVNFVADWGKLLAVMAGVAVFNKARTALASLTTALAGSKLGIAALVVAAPELIDLVADLAAKFHALYNPLSHANKLLKQAEQYQQQATKTNKEAVDKLNELVSAQGQSVDSMDDFRRKIAAGTIVLKDQSGQLGLTADAYKALSKEVKEAGKAGAAYAAQVGDRYDVEAKEVKALAETEAASAAAGLAAQRRKYEAVLSVAQATADAQMQLVDDAAANESQKAALRKQIEQDLQKAKVAALKDWIEALKSGLDEAIAQEKRYAAQALAAHESTEEKVRALRRKGMDEYAATLDQEKQAQEYLAKAQAELAKGTADGFDKAYKWAEKAQGIYENLGNSVKNVGEYGGAGLAALQKYIDGVTNAGAVMEQASTKGKDAFADLAKSLKDQLAEAKTVLADFEKAPLKVNVAVDTDAVDKALDALNGKKTVSDHTVDPDTAAAQKAIADLEKPTSSTHTVYVKEVKEYAAGGPARSVPAMVMPGERIFDPDKAARYAPLLSAINSMTLAREAVGRFATGGGVFRPLRSGMVPGVGDEDSEPVLLQEGAFVVRKAAVAAYGPLLSAIEAGRVPAFASGGFVLPDWLRRIQAARAAQAAAPSAPAVATSATPAPPVAPTPLSVALAAPAAFRGMTTSLAAPAGMTPLGVSGVGRLDGLRQAGALRFASGGNLDETLADIALERQRTKEDYDEAVADAKAAHDDDLADLLAQEQKDLDAIAQTLADTLAELQTAWEEAQVAYAAAMEEAQTDHDDTVADAQSDYAEGLADAKEEYDAKKAELDEALDEAKAAYLEWKNKAWDEGLGTSTSTQSEEDYQKQRQSDAKKSGITYTKAMGGFISEKEAQRFANGGHVRTGSYGGKSYRWKDYSDAAEEAWQEYQAEGKELLATYQAAQKAVGDLGGFTTPPDLIYALSDAKAAAETAFAESSAAAETTLADAQNTFVGGTDDAKTTAATDTAATQDQAASDKADLDKQLADTLDDLKKDFDRAMEDLDIEEARARADADEEKGYSISGFSQWLSQGGPVAALARIRKFAEGGWAALTAKMPHFADGGVAPFPPGAVAGQDSVPVVVRPGEGMIRPEAMAAIISERALAALNDLDLPGFLGALPHYADGGMIPGGAATVAAAARLEPAAASAGGYTATLNLTLGGKTFETRARQDVARELAKQVRRMGGNIV